MFHCYLSGRPWVSRGAERAASVLSMSLTLMQLAPCSSLEPIRRRGSETVRERRAVPPGELTGLFVLQVATMGLFRVLSLLYLGSFDTIIRRCMTERAKYEIADKTA